jgi:shikimate kinase
MKSNKNLVLLGMMGSGKSTIGLSISKKLNTIFFDIDRIIEKDQNMKINEIFYKKGEKFFRYLEEKTTLNALKSSESVISLGGGGWLNEKIRKEITLNNNVSFWLNWDTTTILKRIKKNKRRPLIKNLKDDEIVTLILKRSKVYAKAKYRIDCTKLITKDQITKKILRLYERN